MTPSLGRLTTVPALDRPDLLAPPVAAALAGWEHAGGVGVGSGVRRSKLLVPGALLALLPGAEVVEGLAG